MTNLFEQANDQLPIDDSKNYLEELVGEGKKFQSHEDLARGKYEADQYIEILKKRQDELRADYLKLRDENASKAKLEDLIKQMENQRLASSESTQANEDTKKPAFDPAELDALMSNKIQQHELQRKESDNLNSVMSKLKEQYGSNYVSVLQTKTEELGLSKDDVNTLARKSPKAFFNTLGLGQQQQESFSAPPRSAQRNDNFAPRGAQKRTWSYYQDMKRKDPAAWLNPKIAVQMQQDAIDLGEAFRDGDYFVKGLHEQ